jgi:hypothetical protein
MKRITCFVFAIFAISNFSFAQVDSVPENPITQEVVEPETTESDPAEESDQAATIESLQEQVVLFETTLKNMYEEIKKPDASQLGTFKLKGAGKKVKTWIQPDGNPATLDPTRLHVNKVYVSIKGGVIFTIRVTAGNETFTNKSSSISVTNFEKRKTDKLWSNSGSKFVLLGDVLSYEVEGERYYPDNKNFTLSPTDTVQSVALDPDLDKLISLRVFSDVLGLSGEDNALVQSEFTTSFILNSGNFRNSRVIPFHTIDATLNLNKFDSKFDSLLVDTIGDRFSLMTLNKRSKYSASVNSSIIHYRNIHEFNWRVGLHTSFTNVVDTSGNSAHIWLHSVFSDFIFKVGNEDKRAGLEFHLPIYWQYPGKSPSIGRTISPVFRPEAQIHYKTKKNERSYLFFRYRGFFNWGKGNDLDFAQLQFGYSGSISTYVK